MKLPRALATTAARGSGLVRADVGAVTATGDAGFGAIAGLGRDIRSVGGDIAAIARHKQKISDDTQTDRISQNIKLWSGAQEEALKTTRIETPQDQEKYLAGLTKGYNEMVGLELKDMSSGVQRNVKSQSSRHFPAVHAQARRTSSAKFIEYTTTTELGIAKAEAGTGDIEAANKRVDDLEAKGIIGPKKAAAAKAVNAEVAKESLEGDVIDIGLAVWQGTVTPENPDGDLQAAFDVVENSAIPSQDKQEVESELKTRVTNRRAERQIALEKKQDEDLGGINDLQYESKDYSAAIAAVRDSSLSQKEQRPLLKEIEARARLAAKSEVEVDNPEAVDNISAAINQVGSGLISLKEGKAVLKANQGKLKSTSAAQAWKDINEEFDTNTSNSYKSVRGNTRLKAIGRSESALDALLALIGTGRDQVDLEDRIVTAREKFNLELDNFNRWEAAVKAWRKKNKEASGEDIQKEGIRAWITDFKVPNTPSGLERLRQRSRAASEAIKGPRSTPSRDTFGITKKPKTVRVIDPDGRTGTIPADQLEAAIEAGWRKL